MVIIAILTCGQSQCQTPGFLYRREGKFNTPHTSHLTLRDGSGQLPFAFPTAIIRNQTPTDRLVPIALHIIGKSDIDMQPLRIQPAMIFHQRQRNKRRTKAIERFRLNNTFTVHKSIQNAYQCRTLSGIILQIEQLEPSETGSTESIFHIRFVTLYREMSGGLMKTFRLRGQMILFQPVTEDFKIIRIKHTGIFGNLTIIGIYLELAVLMPHHRTRTAGDGTGIVLIGSRTGIIQNTAFLSIHISKGSAHMGGISVSPTHTAGHKEIFPLLRALPTQVIIRTVAIQMPVVTTAEIIQPLTHHIYLRIQFIAQTEHHERRMVSKMLQQHISFPLQKIIQPLILPLDVTPQRKLYLIVNALYVSRFKCSTRRGERVAAIMIDAILFRYAEDTLPGCHIHRSISRQRKDASIVLTPHESFVTINHELRALYLKLTHTEIHHTVIPVLSGTKCHIQFIKRRVKLTPQ